MMLYQSLGKELFPTLENIKFDLQGLELNRHYDGYWYTIDSKGVGQ